MAIKVIRICDLCKVEYEQIIPKEEDEYTCPIDFLCSDCILEEAIIDEQEAMGTCSHPVINENGTCRTCGIDIDHLT